LQDCFRELVVLREHRDQKESRSEEFFNQYKATLQQIHDQVRGLGNNVVNYEQKKDKEFKKAKRDMKSKIKQIRAQLAQE